MRFFALFLVFVAVNLLYWRETILTKFRKLDPVKSSDEYRSSKTSILLVAVMFLAIGILFLVGELFG